MLPFAPLRSPALFGGVVSAAKLIELIHRNQRNKG
jgi:hypothetical protein